MFFKRILIIFGIIVFLFTLAGLYFLKNKQTTTLSSVNKVLPISIIASNLDTPWALAFLPDHSILVTERQGRVRLIDNSGVLQVEPVAVLKNVQETGEGGLLGITIHPDFSTNNYVYLYYTYQQNSNIDLNRVVRMTYQNKKLIDEKIIIDRIPGSSNHDGGRIKFGPDGYLYITTGDAQNPSQAQNINTLGGKILRVTPDGQPVSDNPFNNLVYSYGHRNPQGLVWDDNGQLWATEHGRSGLSSGLDEINLIEKGKNYGWPTIQGDETNPNMVTPRLNSGSLSTWAPSGMAYYNNSLFFGGLRGQSLYEVKLNQGNLVLQDHFKNQYGRIRDVVLGPDNFLYFTTSNKDGRGLPSSSDDRIVKVDPRQFL